MTYNAYLYNNTLYNAWAAAAATYAAQGRRFYILEVTGATGTLLARLPKWTSAVHRQRVNTFPDLELTYPYDDEFATHLKTGFPNLIALRDRNGELMERFVISSVTKERTDSGARVLTVQASGLMSILSREYVSAYATTVPTAISTIVGDLLSTFQLNGVIRPVSIGTIDAAIGDLLREFAWENQSILTCLRDLQKTVGGYMSVDHDWKFNWVSTLGTSAGQQISATKNIKGLRVVTDYDTIVTRLEGKGYGVTDTTRLVSNQTDAAAELVYGRITRPYAAPAVREQDALDKMTAARLDELATPSVSYAVQTIDLSECDGPLDYSDDAIVLGARVRLIDAELDVLVDSNVIAITRDRARPMDVSIDIANPSAGDDLYADGSPTGGIAGTIGAGAGLGVGGLGGGERTFLDELADLLRKLQELTTQDTGIIQAVDNAAGLGQFDNIGDTAIEFDAAQPEAIDTTSDAGARAKASDSGHVHIGMPWIVAANKAALPVADDGAIGYASDTDRSYVRSNGAWICISHLEV